MLKSSSQTRATKGQEIHLQVLVTQGPSKSAGATLGASGTLLVGRALDAGLRIERDGAISRHHFSIEAYDGRYVVVDMGSANGTLLRNEPIDGRAQLWDGDILQAGQSTFRVQITRPSTASPARQTGPQEANVHRRRLQCLGCNRLFTVEQATVLFDEKGQLKAPSKQLTKAFICRDCYGDKPLETGCIFPGYQTIDTLGEGSMGMVYLVEREADLELFALKILRTDVTPSESTVQRFLREAATLRTLAHRNIVGFVDEGYIDNEFFFVMEFVEGVDLDLYRRQAGGRVPTGRCIDLIAQVLDGLEFAHRHGFVHRDVKPANILVGVEDGHMTPKISDFGLAKQTERANIQPITRGHISFGTPDYMPPEQITQFRKVGPRSDVYSVGATVYHLLSGQTLFEGFGGADPIRTVLEDTPPRLDERASGIPTAIVDVVMKALARKPSRRWETAAAFRDALLRAQALS